MDEKRLKEIEQKVETDPDLLEGRNYYLSKGDVRELIAEVRRLQAGTLEEYRLMPGETVVINGQPWRNMESRPVVLGVPKSLTSPAPPASPKHALPRP